MMRNAGVALLVCGLLGFAPLFAPAVAGEAVPEKPADALDVIRQSEWYKLLNDGQRTYVEWDERAFAYVYDPALYKVGERRAEKEREWIRRLEGPEPGHPGRKRLHPYDEAIFGLATIKSDNAEELLVKIACERVVKDNAHRHFAAKALGILGDPAAIPELIPLVYHFNANVRFDAQVSLVRLTGANFGRDAAAWGAWYNAHRDALALRGELPEFDPTPVDWTFGDDDGELKYYADPANQDKTDRQFLGAIAPETAEPPARPLPEEIQEEVF